MASEKEQFKTQETREKSERPPEKAERPEERITTFEKLKEWGRGVINKIRGKSQEVKTSGNETIESAVSSVKGGQEDIEVGKTAIAEVQGEIETLATESQEEVEGVVGEKAEEEKKVEEISEEKPEKSKEYTTEQQEKIFDLLGKKLQTEKGVITDEELVKLTRETAQESGLEGDIFDNSGDRPLIFYRSFKGTEAVKGLLKKDEMILRPFSFSGPGKSPGRSADIPGAYGGETPMLIRIIDTSGEWEDTAELFGSSPGTWHEAMNWGKVVLRKVDERTMDISDTEKQVGLETPKREQEIPQITYIIDKIKTKEANETKNLEDFANDVGWWNEMEKCASERFSPTSLREGAGESGMRINEKYLEYFDQTMRLDENKVKTEEAKTALKNAKIEICKLVKKAMYVKKDDPNWTPKVCKDVLGSFSKKSWQEYFNILISTKFGKNPTREQKEKLFKERSEEIERKTGKRLNREDYKL